MARLITPPEQVRCRRLVLATDSRLDDIVRRLVDAYRPERVYLFGSRARGEGGPESDYDLLVVVDDSAPRERPLEPTGLRVPAWQGRHARGPARRADAIQSTRPPQGN
jgi:hypothetical protein